MSSGNADDPFLPFLPYFFLALIPSLGTPVQGSPEVRRVDGFVLSLPSGRSVCCSTSKYCVSHGLFPVNWVRRYLSIPSFAERFFFFYHKWVLNFVKCFSCFCWNDHMVFLLYSVNVMSYIYWFLYVRPTFLARFNPVWSRILCLYIAGFDLLTFCLAFLCLCSWDTAA